MSRYQISRRPSERETEKPEGIEIRDFLIIIFFFSALVVSCLRINLVKILSLFFSVLGFFISVIIFISHNVLEGFQNVFILD